MVARSVLFVRVLFFVCAVWILALLSLMLLDDLLTAEDDEYANKLGSTGGAPPGEEGKASIEVDAFELSVFPSRGPPEEARDKAGLEGYVRLADSRMVETEALAGPLVPEGTLPLS